MSQATIRAALEGHLKVWADAHGLPVAWENSDLTPTTNHLRCFILPSQIQNPSMGVEHKRYRGILRVQYFSTALNEYARPIESIMDQLVDLFPRGLAIEKDGLTVNIQSTPSMSRLYIDGQWVYSNIETDYRAEKY